MPTLGSPPLSPLDRALGVSLVEALVATALLAVLASALSGLWLAAIRASAAAEHAAQRTRAVEPYSLPVAVLADPPPECAEVDAAPPGSAPSPCLASVTRCRLEGRSVACDGAGDLAMMEMHVPAGGDGDGNAAVPAGAPLRVWARVPP